MTHPLFLSRCVHIAALLLAVTSVKAQRAAVDPTTTVGVESCRDCHEAIVDSWERSLHATSFTTLAKSSAAEQITHAIGMRADSISSNASCVRCHFTQETLSGAVQTTAAISCESCHGGAEKWIDVHNRKSHSRSERIDLAAALGMKHPSTVFATAKACFECHVVDDEQLVNKASHPALSPDFELLSWYSGEVKHNFLVSKEGSAVKSNSHDAQPIPAPRKRMLYVTGKLLHLAQCLRAIGCAADAPVDKEGKIVRLPNGQPTFGVQHAITMQKVLKDLRELQPQLNAPEISQALGVVESVPMSTGHCEEMSAAAQEIERLTEQFCATNDGSKFAALDGIIDKLQPHLSNAGKPQMAGR
ncbi:MAG: hypothetical protein KDK97_03200 [Verrucomicrobiales bacterium]|nr:hypothetical protein [Verrucomicrobiales bacterium]MCP5556569.1 hypothetical protein [Verrucomicrobiaceae bacterium]